MIFGLASGAASVRTQHMKLFDILHFIGALFAPQSETTNC